MDGFGALARQGLIGDDKDGNLMGCRIGGGQAVNESAGCAALLCIQTRDIQKDS
jgi:hypothetical protein